jgi:hypothetical protein
VVHCQQFQSVWSPAQSACGLLHSDRSKYNLIATLTEDVVLLLIVLVGLLRLRKDGTLLGLGKLLWKQVGRGHLPLTDRSYVSKGSSLASISNHRGGPPDGQSDGSTSSPAFDMHFSLP